MKLFAPLVLALVMAGLTAAQEPPSPPIEPELAAGSRLVDPRAEELVRQMSDLVTGASAFALEAVEIYDEVPEHVPRTQLTNRRVVALKSRPACRRRDGRCVQSKLLVRRRDAFGA